MSINTAVDVSQLPAPKAIEELSFDAIYQDMVSRANEQQPLLFTETGAAELVAAELYEDADGQRYYRVPASDRAGLMFVEYDSDPAAKLLQVSAYRELLLRQRVNDACLANTLAYATGSDLEHYVAAERLRRSLIAAADPSTNTEAIYEEDDALRRRAQLAAEGYSCAGPTGAYEFFAFSASAQVKDVAVENPSDGVVRVSVLSMTGDGTAQPSLLATVNAVLNGRYTRPATDSVVVQSGEPVGYELTPHLTIQRGPDPALVVAEVRAKAAAFVAKSHALGRRITPSALYAALTVPGVENVDLGALSLGVAVEAWQAPYCTNLDVTYEVLNG